MKLSISYTRPSITDLEISYATDAAANGWGERCYEYIGRFESAFCEHLGVKHAIATSSATGALHLGMAALGIGVGDEVILADTNWIATAAPVVYLGAKPVFVDILEDTWCADPELVEGAITAKTKAIIAVHLYGNLCDMNALIAIGKKYGIPVIEDAAEAIGSEYFGHKAGSMGRFGAFSFHGTKTVTTGEGGIFVTDDSVLYEHVLTLSNHGRASDSSRQFWPDVIGYKYKMSNIQAAIGCAQMERIDELILGKKAVFQKYKDHLQHLQGVTMNPESEGTINGVWMPTVVFDKELNITQEKIMKAFTDKNIDARVFFWPLSSLPMFEAKKENILAWDIHSRAVNLPSYHDLRVDQIERISKVIEELFI